MNNPPWSTIKLLERRLEDLHKREDTLRKEVSITEAALAAAKAKEKELNRGP